MPRSYPPEFRRKVLDLIAAGRTVAQVAHDLQVSGQTIYTWRRQEQVDSGQAPGLTSAEKSELSAARRRIAELETELAVHRWATDLLKGAVRPKARFAAIAAMVKQSLPIQVACRVLEVSESGFHAWRNRAPSARSVRHAWLTDLIVRIHAAARGVYGARRVHAELTMSHGVAVSHGTVEMLMQRAGIKGLPGNKRRRPRPEVPTAADLVDRDFTRDAPNRLWITDITEHRTREGKVYCAVVLDAFSRKVGGWSIDSRQDAALVTNALGMAIHNRERVDGTVIHSDHGVQFTSWAFTRRAKESGLLPSMGSIGDCFDNAMMESFWGRMQTELLDRRRWRTRIELANAIFEYLEIFHNRQRRHSALGMLTPIEYERLHTVPTVA